MKSFHFSCGNSTEGIIGMCAEVVADTREEAILKLQKVLENRLGAFGEVSVDSDQPAIRYISLYINPTYINDCQIEEQQEAVVR